MNGCAVLSQLGLAIAGDWLLILGDIHAAFEDEQLVIGVAKCCLLCC